MTRITAPNASESLAIGWELLPRVSRSFALVTRYLAEDDRSRLGDAVMAFYLVCRVLDTIEDSRIPAREKRPLYRGFLASLDGGSPFIFENPERLTSNAGYVELLRQAEPIVQAFGTLDEIARSIIRRRAGEMSEGMAAFGDRPIRTLADLDDYCHPVAVVVGYGLTELFHHHGHLPVMDARTFLLARHFGLALQKVNITRDFGQDLASGRHFWPSEILERHGLDDSTVAARRASQEAMAALGEMIDGIRESADGALQYILLVPPREEKLRMFCAVSLLLALETLAKVRGNPDVFDVKPWDRAPRSLKVSRAELQSMVASLAPRVADDEALAAAYRDARARAFRA